MEKYYKRKFEELERCLNRIKKLYNGKIINEKGEDGFQSPKDLFLNFFRVSYELKENLKLEKGFGGYDGIIETFCNLNDLIGLALDIANSKKHGKSDKKRTFHIIGEINTGIHIFDLNGKNRTEILIEIDGKKEDGLELCKNVFNEWESFLLQNNLIDLSRSLI